jgi:hypothetical protein
MSAREDWRGAAGAEGTAGKEGTEGTSISRMLPPREPDTRTTTVEGGSGSGSESRMDVISALRYADRRPAPDMAVLVEEGEEEGRGGWLVEGARRAREREVQLLRLRGGVD